LITPDQSWPQDFVAFIQQNGTVHLTGESNTGDFIDVDLIVFNNGSNCTCGRSPPVAGILFGPPSLRRREGFMLYCFRRDDLAVMIN
jgi:hypothetical protein